MLDSRRLENSKGPVPADWTIICTPLRAHEWEVSLRHHPDEWYREYLVRGMREGFRIGFKYSECSCKSAKTNMQSAVQNPQVIDDYLSREVALGRVLGPLEPSTCQSLHINRFGVIPKGHQVGKWRLILDLSYPSGASVNDGIEPELCSLKYTSVDEAVRIVCQLGAGALLAKFDVESAYRLIPVHPDDRMLLGMLWKEKAYVDMSLPFGLRSAPKIFTAVADALHWILTQQGTTARHYLDDFLLFGAPGSEECTVALQRSLQCCARLGVPIASHKTEGPSTKIVFLGIELDTDAGIVRLPHQKLIRLKAEIVKWLSRKSCTKRELLSLIGQLQHACCVVKPGRTFLRRMISLSTVAKELHHKIRLNVGFRSDLQWWASFLPRWNGVSMFAGGHPHRFSVTVTSDASGSWGCGAFNCQGGWFQLQWPESWSSIHITVKELLPIVMSVAVWGHRWQGKCVRCRCDNAAVVAIIRKGSSKEPRVMHLMRSLFFFLASYDITLWSVHVPGILNGAADALSRNDHLSFLSQVPSAQPLPEEIQPVLMEALVHKQPDWTSPSWTNLLTSTLRRV